VSAANLGGVADPRLGEQADYIGTSDEGRAGIPHEIPAPDTHGHNTIYLDSSITFENYRYWATRTREFEKHMRTDNVGLQGIGNTILGRKAKLDQQHVDRQDAVTGAAEKGSDNEEKTAGSNEKSGINGISLAGFSDGWSHGVTESDWEQAQRATRTATWGECTAPLWSMGPFSNGFAQAPSSTSSPPTFSGRTTCRGRLV
jgi:hypothetical protein